MLWLERNGDAIAIDVYDFFRSMQLSGLIDLQDYRTCVLEAFRSLNQVERWRQCPSTAYPALHGSCIRMSRAKHGTPEGTSSP